jgi:hypothetical protein
MGWVYFLYDRTSGKDWRLVTAHYPENSGNARLARRSLDLLFFFRSDGA